MRNCKWALIQASYLTTVGQSVQTVIGTTFLEQFLF